MLVCSFALEPIEAGDGGFGCIPASHKASYSIPTEIARSPTAPGGTGGAVLPVVNVACPKVAVGETVILLTSLRHLY